MNGDRHPQHRLGDHPGRDRGLADQAGDEALSPLRQVLLFLAAFGAAMLVMTVISLGIAYAFIWYLEGVLQ